jgi:GNAT superfamily N-acetyltransferase
VIALKPMASIHILGAGAAQGLATAIARHEGVALSGTFGAVGSILAKFLAGEACDILVLTHAQLAQLTARNRVALDLVSDLGAVRTSVAVRAGDERPDVSTPAAPREALLATVYTVALNAGAVPAQARDFALQLTGREWGAARAAAGFEGAAIRRATPADSSEARELVFTVLAEYGFVPEPQGTDADLADLGAGFLAGGGMFDVAVDPDGRLAACCGMKILEDGRLELRKMYVRGDRRGQGLGRRLLERALAWARARGHRRVELETASRLQEAIALYRKAGFVPRPGKPDTCRCDLAFVLELD